MCFTEAPREPGEDGRSTDNSTLSNKKKLSRLGWWGKLVVAGEINI